MSFDIDYVSSAVLLAINLLSFGIPLAIGIGIAFRLTRSFPPRIRYIIAVTAFCIASFYPVWLTFETVKSQNFDLPVAAIVSKANSDSAHAADGNSAKSVNTGKSLDYTGFFGLFIQKLIGLILTSGIGSFILAVWLMMTAFLIGRDLTGYFELRRLKRKWSPASLQLCRELEWDNSVPLLTDEKRGPGTVGFLKPVVIIPSELFNTIPIYAARHIARHELSHARWRDPLINSIIRLIRAVFWISPALWFLERIICVEREAAADRAAIASDKSLTCDNEATFNYADSLLRIAHILKNGNAERNYDLTAIHFGQQDGLENRVKRLFIMRTRLSYVSLILAGFTILAGISSAFSLSLVKIPLEVTHPIETKDQPAPNSQKDSTAKTIAPGVSGKTEKTVPFNFDEQGDQGNQVKGAFLKETGLSKYKFTSNSANRKTFLQVSAKLDSGSAVWTLISPEGKKSFKFSVGAGSKEKAQGNATSNDLDFIEGDWIVTVETKNATGNFEMQWTTR